MDRPEDLKLEVDCYSGRKRKKGRFVFDLAGQQYVVEEVLDQWYGPHDAFYFRADDGNLYILRQNTSTPEGSWYLVSFRQLLRES